MRPVLPYPNSEKLNPLLFPVELVPVYVSGRKGERQGNIFPDSLLKAQCDRLLRHLAIRDKQSGEVFTVVSKGYDLVSNEEALTDGFRIFSQLFPKASSVSNFEIAGASMTKSRGACVIDVIHREYRTEVFGGDPWCPFIRIENSYNRTKALSYVLGFHRLKSPLRYSDSRFIIGSTAARIKRVHTKDAKVDWSGDRNRLREIEREFVEGIRYMKDYEVKRLYGAPLIAKALRLTFKVDAEDDQKRRRERQKLNTFRTFIAERLNERYKEHGVNLYAVFHAMIDYASSRAARRFNTPYYNVEVQNRAGEWFSSYPRISSKPDFDIDRYLGDLVKLFV